MAASTLHFPLPSFPFASVATVFHKFGLSALFLVPSIVAVAIFQRMPFESRLHRLLLTAVFGAIMFALLLMAYIVGACSYGDCF